MHTTPTSDGICIGLSRLALQWPAGLSFRPRRSYPQAMSTDPRNPDLKVMFVRAPQDLVARLDRWRGTQADVPNRSDAIRRILDERLRADGVTRPRRRAARWDAMSRRARDGHGARRRRHPNRRAAPGAPCRSRACSSGQLEGALAVPIRPEYRWFYPIDWPQLSAEIRFRRAGGRCESCGRPHGQIVFALPDGRWWDEIDRNWRSGRGKLLARQQPKAEQLMHLKPTRVSLAAAHRDHDPTNNRARNLVAFCQRCHLLHDREEHKRRRRLTLLRRKALGDLFSGAYR